MICIGIDLRALADPEAVQLRAVWSLGILEIGIAVISVCIIHIIHIIYIIIHILILLGFGILC